MRIKNMVIGLAFALIPSTFGTITNLQFISAISDGSGGIKIKWQSRTNEVYRIDYADSLVNSNTQFQTLYEDYPSHGTNTFISDYGNYDTTPEIPLPRISPKRFYRIAVTDTNSSPTNPTVSITWPTNNATLTGDVWMAVSSSSPEVLNEVKLYIDGEEQWRTDDGTNFLINTCEWPNDSHTIFATAKSQSVMEGNPHNGTITYGRKVSSYVTVTFDNLITSFDFSEPFFEPSSGQTQQISATFAANVDWILQIQNSSTQNVLYITNYGSTLLYNWDGTGTNHVAIPDGVYSYLLTVHTNGRAISGGGGGTNSGPPSPPSGAMTATTGEETDSTPIPNSIDSALAGGLDYYFTSPPPIPPVWVNGGWQFWETVFGAEPPIKVPVPIRLQEQLLAVVSGTPGITMDTVSYGMAPVLDALTPHAQAARGPKRKPRVGVKNVIGTFGILYKTYGPTGFFKEEPRTGNVFPLQVHVAIDDLSASSSLVDYGPLKSTKNEAIGFARGMEIAGYKQKFLKGDTEWGPVDLQSAAFGGTNIFNSCNFGLLSCHGVYGTTTEIDGVKYTYFPLWDTKHGSSYVRLSDMDLGSPGTTGLRWMTFLSCNTFKAANITSMANNSKLPDNNYLHLMLGANSYLYADNWFGFSYATNLVVGTSIWQSFQNAGNDAYARDYLLAQNRSVMTNTVTFRVIGDNACISDTLYLYNDPEFFTQIFDKVVFTPTP